MDRPRRNQIVAFAFGALCVAVQPAIAADGKVVSGYDCVETNAVANAAKVGYSDFGAATLTANYAEVVCPVPRDVLGASMDIIDWDVTVRRSSGAWTSADWTLVLFSLSQNGSSGQANTVTVPTGSGYHTIDGGTIPPVAAEGILVVMSDMPPGGHIIRIHTEEE